MAERVEGLNFLSRKIDSHKLASTPVLNPAPTPRSEGRPLSDGVLDNLMARWAGEPITNARKPKQNQIEDTLNESSVGALAARCAPTSPAAALVSIVRVESHFQPYAIGVIGSRRRMYKFAAADDAIRMAHRLLSEGANIDVGLAQINIHNFGHLGLSLDAAFDACRNLTAASIILNKGYERALKTAPPNRPILQMAYSIYNTGNADEGLLNGYVQKVEGR